MKNVFIPAAGFWNDRPQMTGFESDTVRLSTGSEIPVDQLERQHELDKAAEQLARRERIKRAAEIYTDKECPFDDPMNGAKRCRRDCALYGESGCRLKRGRAEKDTEKMRCPFFRKCRSDCAMYDGGCTL